MQVLPAACIFDDALETGLRLVHLIAGVVEEGEVKRRIRPDGRLSSRLLKQRLHAHTFLLKQTQFSFIQQGGSNPAHYDHRRRVVPLLESLLFECQQLGQKEDRVPQPLSTHEEAVERYPLPGHDLFSNESLHLLGDKTHPAHITFSKRITHHHESAQDADAMAPLHRCRLCHCVFSRSQQRLFDTHNHLLTLHHCFGSQRLWERLCSQKQMQGRGERHVQAFLYDVVGKQQHPGRQRLRLTLHPQLMSRTLHHRDS